MQVRRNLGYRLESVIRGEGRGVGGQGRPLPREFDDFDEHTGRRLLEQARTRTKLGKAKRSTNLDLPSVDELLRDGEEAEKDGSLARKMEMSCRELDDTGVAREGAAPHSRLSQLQLNKLLADSWDSSDSL